MTMRDPGLDRHEWQTEYEALEDDLHSSPVEALPELHDLVARMLDARGFRVDDPVEDDGVEPDVLVSFRAGREVAAQVDRGDEVDLGDVAEAIHAFTEIYEQLIDRPDN